MPGIWFAENDTDSIVDQLTFAIDNTIIDDAEMTLHVAELRTGFTGKITNATDASPIVITAPNHGLANGDKILVLHVKGNRAANGAWTIGSVTTNAFTLVGSAGDGAYIEGGDWYVSVPGAEAIAYSLTDSGRYRAQLPRSIPVVVGRNYLVVLRCATHGLEAEDICLCNQRRG